MRFKIDVYYYQPTQDGAGPDETIYWRTDNIELIPPRDAIKNLTGSMQQSLAQLGSVHIIDEDNRVHLILREKLTKVTIEFADALVSTN